MDPVADEVSDDNHLDGLQRQRLFRQQSNRRNVVHTVPGIATALSVTSLRLVEENLTTPTS